MNAFLRSRWGALVMLVLSLLVAGCITIGEKFRPEAIEQIKPGQTTDKDVLQIFGNPVRTGINDGVREWTYAHYKASAFGKFEGRDLVIKFNSDGTVKSYSYSTTDPKEDIVKPK